MRSSTLPILGMPEGLTYQEQAHWISRHNLFNTQTLDELNLHRWQRTVDFDVRIGAIGGLMQAASMFKLFGDQQDALTNEKFDASARLGLGLMSLAGTVTEAIGNFMYNKEVLKLSTSVGVTRGQFQKMVGRRLGILAAIVVAGFDVRKAVESANENQAGMVWLYGLSAVFGFALSGAMMLSFLMPVVAIPVIGTLLLIVIAISVAIEYNKDNPLQDWLERCPWGVLPQQRYIDFDTMHSELNKVLKPD
jgi:hypothetical protein